MATRLAPYYPIIYVRGYAMTPGEVAETVSTPYMGFNLGASKLRQCWDGKVQRHVFESPLIRLMKDYGYRDTYSNGTEVNGPIPARSLIIYRYYESADTDLGQGVALSIPEAAQGLKALIHQVRGQVCGEDTELLKQFKVHLVAHSMGGLVVRAFLQNDQISSQADRDLVDKVFTYATPHNGIEMAGMNVPAVLGMWDLNNFNCKNMAEFFGLSDKQGRVDSLDGKFDPQRFFCFVGTNHRDYEVAMGLSRRLAGEMSDGLVKVENATVAGAPRAFAFRSHSGPYGVVNSEEGYQNLTRFLFGDLRADGIMDVEALPLPPSVQKAKDSGKTIRASYYFEATVAPRGAFSFRLTERRRDTFSAVLRGYDELLMLENTTLDKPRAPVLFSAFLDTGKITVGKTAVFSLELAVSATGYTIANNLWLDQHVEGEYLFRDTLTLRITQTATGYNLRYLHTDERWSEGTGRLAEQVGEDYLIPLSSQKGFKGRLRLRVQRVDA
ncbi:MAG: esterase/lipase family protein [Gammaproteobacteria bacterium]